MRNDELKKRQWSEARVAPEKNNSGTIHKNVEDIKTRRGMNRQQMHALKERKNDTSAGENSRDEVGKKTRKRRRRRRRDKKERKKKNVKKERDANENGLK